MELRGEERKVNIKGAFGLKPGQKVKAAGYVIFDDVATTGSTLGEIAKVLKRNGAKEVWGLTIAG
jgi:predicted amidophosphoribosyltransferase